MCHAAATAAPDKEGEEEEEEEEEEGEKKSRLGPPSTSRRPLTSVRLPPLQLEMTTGLKRSATH